MAMWTNAQITTIWSENFDEEDLSGWTLVDGDGDGWGFATAQMLDNNWSPIGTPFLYSLSYTQYDNIGDVFPDNWAITPLVDLSSVPVGSLVQLNWSIVDSTCTWNPSPNNENYSIYIAESTDTNEFISAGVKYNESNTPVSYTVRTLNLSDYAGKKIYIAFRHHDVSDAIAVPFSSSIEFDDMSVTVEPDNSLAEIVSFSFAEEALPSVINTESATVTSVVVYGTNLTDLTPTIEVSQGAQVSSTIPSDFTNPVEILVEAQNGTTKTWTIRVSVAVGLNDNDLNSIAVVPNPFNDHINLSSTVGVSKIVITNILGSIVKTIHLPETSMNTQGLNKGVYFVTIFNQNHNYKTIRMVKQ